MLIYISYDSHDEKYAEKLRKGLVTPMRSLGFTLWGKSNIQAGQELQIEMAEHLKDAWLFLPILTSEYFSSKRCMAESRAAITLHQINGLHILNIYASPVLLEFDPLSRFPVILGEEKSINEYQNKEKAWMDTCSVIVKKVKSLQIGEKNANY